MTKAIIAVMLLYKNATKTSNTQRLQTDLGRSVGVTTVTPTGVVKLVYGIPTFPLTMKAVQSKCRIQSSYLSFKKANSPFIKLICFMYNGLAFRTTLVYTSREPFDCRKNFINLHLLKEEKNT